MYKGIRKTDYKRIDRCFEICDRLDEDIATSEEKNDLLTELLGVVRHLSRKYPINLAIADLAILYVQYGGAFGEVMLLIERQKNVYNDAYLRGFLGESYLKAGMIFLAYVNLSYYIEHEKKEIPDGLMPMYEDLKLSYNKLYQELVEEQELGLEDVLECEKGRMLINIQDFESALKIFTTVKKKYPRYTSAVNNSGISLMYLGRLVEAESVFNKILANEPGNAFALAQSATLAIYRNDQPTAVDLRNRLMETGDKEIFTYLEMFKINALLCDNQSNLTLFREYESDNIQYNCTEAAIIDFMAGIAFLKAGDQTQGVRLVRQCQKLKNPLADLPQNNLDDLEKAVGERNGPACFSLHNIFPVFLIRKILMQTSESITDEKFRKILSENKTLISALLPAALYSGDDAIRRWYIDAYVLTGWDGLHEPLYDFMLSQQGTDELRRIIYNVLNEKEPITESVEIYQKGEKIVTRSITITWEPQDKEYTKDQRELNNQAFFALEDGDYTKAVSLLERFLEEYEEFPTVLNNLAKAYEHLGRLDECEVLITRLGEKFPDYFFYRIIQAQTAIKNGHSSKARKILDSLNGNSKYHASEMKALCRVNISYYLQKKDSHSALEWYKTAARFFPDDPEFDNPEKLENLSDLQNFLQLIKNR